MVWCTVVGDPIRCEQIDTPTADDIDALRVRYIQGLQDIFTAHADQYAKDRKSDLRIVK